MGLDKQGISDVPPREYRDRMIERVIGKVQNRYDF